MAKVTKMDYRVKITQGGLDYYHQFKDQHLSAVRYAEAWRHSPVQHVSVESRPIGPWKTEHVVK